MSTAVFDPLICIVDFHHARGPEIETWIGLDHDRDPSAENDWSLIPYMALPDGAHQSEEEFSYFSLVYKCPGKHENGQTAVSSGEATTVFGISCIHQIPASELKFKSEDVTRSAVQKAVVVITDRPQDFSALREKLSVVTRAWFAQKDFREREILERFRENLVKLRSEVSGLGIVNLDGSVGGYGSEEKDQYFGLSLREIIHEFKGQALVLFKSLILQPKMLFFGTHCERVCQVQFTLLSLIPGLIRNLQDCADPTMSTYAQSVKKMDSVRTSDRSSLLAYMGLPLNLFGKGSVFGPYTPLQQLDTLTDLDTKSYVVGSTNNLLVQQKDRYCDILIDLDDDSVQILSPSLRTSLALSHADKRWINFVTNAVNETWDENDPSRPKTHGYVGSEEFIRFQFEEYLLAMLSATKYSQYLAKNKDNANKALLNDIDGDPSLDFSSSFIDSWRETENYKLWDRLTDSHIFDIVEPRHPHAGGFTIDDVQRRLAAQVADLHLDERFNQTREVVGKRIADGRTHVTSAFNKVMADIEVMREAQRKRAEENRIVVLNAAGSTNAQPIAASTDSPRPSDISGSRISESSSSPTIGTTASLAASSAASSVSAAGQRAGAYLSSWGTWASEKRKNGWTNNNGATTSRSSTPPPISMVSNNNDNTTTKVLFDSELGTNSPEAKKTEKSTA